MVAGAARAAAPETVRLRGQEDLGVVGSGLQPRLASHASDQLGGFFLSNQIY